MLKAYNEGWATRKGTRVEFTEEVPDWEGIPGVPIGAKATVVENTNNLAYKVIFDGEDGKVWTIGAYQVRKIWEPPTYAELEAALARIDAVLAEMPTEAPEMWAYMGPSDDYERDYARYEVAQAIRAARKGE